MATRTPAIRLTRRPRGPARSRCSAIARGDIRPRRAAGPPKPPSEPATPRPWIRRAFRVRDSWDLLLVGDLGEAHREAAAVGDQGGPGHDRRLVAREEQTACGDLVGGGRPPEGGVRGQEAVR